MKLKNQKHKITKGTISLIDNLLEDIEVYKLKDSLRDNFTNFSKNLNKKSNICFDSKLYFYNFKTITRENR